MGIHNKRRKKFRPVSRKVDPVAAQTRSPRMSPKYRRSNGSFHRVLACSAGSPGFDSRVRYNILRCSMQKNVDGSGQASTTRKLNLAQFLWDRLSLKRRKAIRISIQP
jgi:hypothetical protein